MQENDPGQGASSQGPKKRGSGGIELPGGGVLEPRAEKPQIHLDVDFGDLVRPFLMMGLTGVGVLPHPDSGTGVVDLQAAQHAIGTLEILKERTEGRRSEEESQMIDQALFELKMQYVDAQGRVEEK